MVTLYLIGLSIASFALGFMTYRIIESIARRIDRYLMHKRYVKLLKELNKNDMTIL